MYPPKIADSQVLAVIRELFEREGVPSGVRVRLELGRRYGSRGGVARIYRLLAAERSRQTRAPSSSVSSRLLDLENRHLREALRNAQQREQTHQVYWERKVGELRGDVATLRSLIERAWAKGSPLTEGVCQAVREAEIRAGHLEVGLRAFGPGAAPPQIQDDGVDTE